MDVTPHELRTIELREAFRGYRQDDVDDLLDRVAGTIERLQAQVRRLNERVERAEGEAGLGREADEMLRRTLLLAQRTADAAVGEAQERARRVLSESEAHAHSIVSGAEEEARRVAIAERHRLEGEVRDLAQRREALLTDVDQLESAAADYRRRMRTFLEAEMAALDARPAPERPARPEVHDVEVPVADTAEGQAPHVSDDTGEPTRAISLAEIEAGEYHIDALEARDPADAGSAAVADVDTTAAAGEPPAAEHWPAEADDERAGEGDDPRLDDLLPRRRAWRRVNLPEPDDDFFADLRDAVRGEEPLGPSGAPDQWDGEGRATGSTDADDHGVHDPAPRPDEASVEIHDDDPGDVPAWVSTGPMGDQWTDHDEPSVDDPNGVPQTSGSLRSVFRRRR